MSLGQEPRVGVFVCNCGINIGGVADVPAVREYAKTLPHVVHVEDNLFTCSQDTQDQMKEVIKEKGSTGWWWPRCSPRTHEPLFQETIREAGLNKYLFEMANIRDQNTWVHMNNPEGRDRKGQGPGAHGRGQGGAGGTAPSGGLGLTHAGLVIGGGVAGMEAALGLADQGYPVTIVEQEDRLGGVSLKLRNTWRGESIQDYMSGVIERVSNHPEITVQLNSKVTAMSGIVGNYTTTISPLNGAGEPIVLEHGVTIMATGGHEYNPTEYLHGQHDAVMTALEFDQAVMNGDARIKDAKSAAFIQCVGSRIPERPYCSRICCTHSLESAVHLKEMNPDMNVFILYRDMRSYGFREDLYREAREKGVIFMRFDLENLPQVSANGDGSVPGGQGSRACSGRSKSTPTSSCWRRPSFPTTTRTCPSCSRSRSTPKDSLSKPTPN